jgi:Tetrapyrrole (Corrin/Porphyrin) Methylases
MRKRTGKPSGGSLVVVGTGIRLGAHATLETVTAIQSAQRVFFLVTEPATEEWIRRLNPACESLEDLYVEGKSRQKTYLEMTDRILEAVSSGLHVCAAFYGHPAVFVDATHRAIQHARAEGYPARMLPGISAEDCLFADLGVNPGDNGCQTFEATDFLASRRRFDPTSELILYQVGVLGEPSVKRGMKCRPERLKVLTKSLCRHYPASHLVFLYEASPFPTVGSSVMKMRLGKLPQVDVPPMATLYVPARAQRRPLQTITRWFDES